MSKLIVLSEIDCHKFLDSRGINADEFYTDFKMFKNKSSSFYDCNVVIIFAGACHFSKRHVIDMIRQLEKRVSNASDDGIRSLLVFTDIIMPRLKKYYKFQGKLANVSEYSGWKVTVKKSPIWDEIPDGENDNTAYFYSDFDKGYIEGLREEYKSATTVDEDLRPLIKKIDFSSISEI